MSTFDPTPTLESWSEEGCPLASGFRTELRSIQGNCALVPEHHLPALIHTHNMVPREAPGHSIDSSAEEREDRPQRAAGAGDGAACKASYKMGSQDW